jgi:hypothetical protein
MCGHLPIFTHDTKLIFAAFENLLSISFQKKKSLSDNVPKNEKIKENYRKLNGVKKA